MDNRAQHQLRLADITREANYALWNALLTLNGIIISVFSAVAVFSSTAKILSFVLITISMLSAALLIVNFLGTRNQFRRIREVTEHGEKDLSAEERKEQIEATRRSQRWCHRRETTTHFILGVQGVLILVLVYFKS